MPSSHNLGCTETGVAACAIQVQALRATHEVVTSGSIVIVGSARAAARFEILRLVSGQTAKCKRIRVASLWAACISSIIAVYEVPNHIHIVMRSSQVSGKKTCASGGAIARSVASVTMRKSTTV